LREAMQKRSRKALVHARFRLVHWNYARKRKATSRVTRPSSPVITDPANVSRSPSNMAPRKKGA
jgi:hypothetical protein